MKKIEVYDPAMCCSSGVCGPSVDPQLSQFSADLDWLSRQKVGVKRYNLSQEPKAFAASGVVKAALEKEGPECLPIIVSEGKIVSMRRYPSRSRLAAWAGVPLNETIAVISEPCCSPAKSSKGKAGKSCC